MNQTTVQMFDTNNQFYRTGATVGEMFNALPIEIYNPANRNRMRVVHSPATGARGVKFEFTLPPHDAGTPPHYHLKFDETFEVLDGELEMMTERLSNRQIVTPGTVISIPRGVLHNFRNASDKPVTFVSEALPAAEFERFIRIMFGLGADGKTHSSGMPKNFLEFAVALDFADLYLPFVPAWLQCSVRAGLRRIARASGAERRLEKYYLPMA